MNNERFEIWWEQEGRLNSDEKATARIAWSNGEYVASKGINTTTQTLNLLRDIAHATATQHGWWDDNRSTGEALLKVIVEVAEAVQALEAGNPPDKHLPDFDSLTVELADTVIRILDLAGRLYLPLGAAIVAKMAFNESRPYRHGKQF
jgi:NTP pyrophosphatase (non-canonical NTP hydrolase)